MTDVLGSMPWSDFSTGGLLALAVLLIIRGDLVPRRTHEAVIADRDFWRQKSGEKDATIAVLAEGARASVGVLEQLPKAKGE